VTLNSFEQTGQVEITSCTMAHNLAI
jgi:hypothetical protein